MPRRLRIHLPGGFYHVTLRGNHQQAIFFSDRDRILLNVIVAEAIEKCFYIDLSGGSDPLGFDVDGAAGTEVKLVTTTEDGPTGIRITVPSPSSEVTYTLGEAWSMAAMIRKAGHGTAYVPPSP